MTFENIAEERLKRLTETHRKTYTTIGEPISLLAFFAWLLGIFFVIVLVATFIMEKEYGYNFGIWVDETTKVTQAELDARLEQAKNGFVIFKDCHATLSKIAPGMNLTEDQMCEIIAKRYPHMGASVVDQRNKINFFCPEFGEYCSSSDRQQRIVLPESLK